eukprot:TRINITY_DN22767_c0_g1_i1.p1 TRINITY_DN22767_c0_g1~~TRINITY_DN22767_c0_g1_i1.p1  ORF type:complete len:250 (-),score=19.63 TRINITY_DN22767_c0_g1_i1:143-892(-)
MSTFAMGTLPSFARDERNHAARVGATILATTVLLSSYFAYSLGHVGSGPGRLAGIAGCRSRRQLLQDISCSGVNSPEYWIFSFGFSAGSLCYVKAAMQSAVKIEMAMGRRYAQCFLAFAVVANLFCIAMAWISLGMNPRLHLVFAKCMMLCWGISALLRVYSAVPPSLSLSLCTTLATICLFSIWAYGQVMRKPWAAAEWWGFACFLVYTLTLPGTSKPFGFSTGITASAADSGAARSFAPRLAAVRAQ